MDVKIARPGFSEFTDNGTPGTPRLAMTPISRGPGLPGPFPSGPLQPHVAYNGRIQDESIF